MEDKEKIQSFGDMVSATEKLAEPYKKFAFGSIIALIATNLFWAIIVGMLVFFAYMTPAEMSQEQNFDTHQQSQSYTEGATNGD